MAFPLKCTWKEWGTSFKNTAASELHTCMYNSGTFSDLVQTNISCIFNSDVEKVFKSISKMRYNYSFGKSMIGRVIHLVGDNSNIILFRDVLSDRIHCTCITGGKYVHQLIGTKHTSRRFLYLTTVITATNKTRN